MATYTRRAIDRYGNRAITNHAATDTFVLFARVLREINRRNKRHGGSSGSKHSRCQNVFKPAGTTKSLVLNYLCRGPLDRADVKVLVEHLRSRRRGHDVQGLLEPWYQTKSESIHVRAYAPKQISEPPHQKVFLLYFVPSSRNRKGSPADSNRNPTPSAVVTTTHPSREVAKYHEARNTM